MALIGNRSVLLKSPGRFLSGTVASIERSNFNKPGMMVGRFETFRRHPDGGTPRRRSSEAEGWPGVRVLSQGQEGPAHRSARSQQGLPHQRMRLATSSSMTSVAPPPIDWTRASRAMRSIGVPRM